MRNENLIEMKHVSKTFPGVKALNDISFGIRAGEIHALAGENGAGKSTLIKILTGVYEYDRGSAIYMNGGQVKIQDPSVAAQMGISVIYQDFSLFANMTVAENILFGHKISEKSHLVNWKQMRLKAKNMLKELEIDIDIDEFVENLSVGKQQMVAIAKALIFESKLLIMDEPTSTLSNAEVEHLLYIMKKLKNCGVTILFITHKLDEIYKVADRVSVLRDGGFVGTYALAELSKNRLINLMVGREIAFVKQAGAPREDVVLSVENISKKGNYADISFELRRGEILGITGLVGAGRSEVLMTLFGLIRPDSGRIRLNGKPVSLKSSVAAEKLGIAFIPENRLTEGISMENTIRENITIAALSKLRTKAGFIDKKRETEMSFTYAKKLDLRPLRIDIAAKNLSGGNQQKVVIAKWLANEPEILLVDEPTNGIDVGAKAEIHSLLNQLANQGKSIIIVSSEMPEIIALCDRTLVMRQGRIAAELHAGEITQEAMMKAALI